MRSGELARICGISTDTLRHYERVGVLPRPKRTPGGYRQYPSEALKRVQLVRRALEIGFTLDDLAGFCACGTLAERRAGKCVLSLRRSSIR